MVERVDYSNSEYYKADWFLKRWGEILENPVTSCLTACFVTFSARAKSGHWGPAEEIIATILLRQGMPEEEGERIIPDLLDILKRGGIEPMHFLERYRVEYLEGIRNKTVKKQVFTDEEKLLAALLILEPVSDQRVGIISRDLLAMETADQPGQFGQIFDQVKQARNRILIDGQFCEIDREGLGALRGMGVMELFLRIGENPALLSRFHNTASDLVLKAENEKAEKGFVEKYTWSEIFNTVFSGIESPDLRGWAESLKSTSDATIREWVSDFFGKEDGFFLTETQLTNASSDLSMFMDQIINSLYDFLQVREKIV